jgi:hypothetical protein
MEDTTLQDLSMKGRIYWPSDPTKGTSHKPLAPPDFQYSQFAHYYSDINSHQTMSLEPIQTKAGNVILLQ